jgi:hypothetical protein
MDPIIETSEARAPGSRDPPALGDIVTTSLLFRHHVRLHAGCPGDTFPKILWFDRASPGLKVGDAASCAESSRSQK